MTGPVARLALILGKQGSGKTTRVIAALQQALAPLPAHEGAGGALPPVHFAPNHFNHVAYDADGDLAFVGGVHLGKAPRKVKDLRGLHVLEFPHAGYLPPGSNRDLNNGAIETRIFHLELPESAWKAIGGSTGMITSPEYFMANGRREQARAECDYAADAARIRDDIARCGVPAEHFASADAMVDPIVDFLLLSADGRWTDAQLRAFVELRMGKTRARGHQGKAGLLGYQVVDFGNGMRSAGDTDTPEKLAFIVDAAGIDVRGSSFLDAGCNMGSIVFELKKRGAGRCVGLDVHQPALEVARAIERNWFRFGGVAFVRESLVEPWDSRTLGTREGERFDCALALSVLHKDGVRSRLDDVVRNLTRFAKNAIVEIPFEPQPDYADWDHARVRALLDAHYRVTQLASTDFHSACGARDLLLCEGR